MEKINKYTLPMILEIKTVTESISKKYAEAVNHRNYVSPFDKSIYQKLGFEMRYNSAEAVSEVKEEGGDVEDVTADIGKKEEFEFITNEFFSDADKSETKIYSTDKKGQLIVVNDGKIYSIDDASAEIEKRKKKLLNI